MGRTGRCHPVTPQAASNRMSLVCYPYKDAHSVVCVSMRWSLKHCQKLCDLVTFFVGMLASCWTTSTTLQMRPTWMRRVKSFRNKITTCFRCFFGFLLDWRPRSCMLLWQVCLVQVLVHLVGFYPYTIADSTNWSSVLRSYLHVNYYGTRCSSTFTGEPSQYRRLCTSAGFLHPWLSQAQHWSPLGSSLPRRRGSL